MKNRLQVGEGASFANSQQGAVQDRDRGEGVSTQNDSPRSRPWLIAVPTVILVLLGVIWSGFWYWSTTTTEATMTSWSFREAEAGRIYGCASTDFGGYPFRIEVTCAEPSVDDRATALSVRARNLAAVAQVWDPTLVIGEMGGPRRWARVGGSPTAMVDWPPAQASLRGVPGAPERLSIVVDKPSLASVPPAGTLASAEHMEFHGRFAAESTPGHPALDLGFDLRNATAPALVAALGTFGPLASASTDLSLVAVLRGTSDLAPKPLGQRLREIQAANGRLDISNARLQQGDLIATATGALGLTARGTLTGDLRLTVVNFTKLIPLLGIGNVLRGRNSADSNAPGTGANPYTTGTVLGTTVLGGQQTELEGQRAVTLTLRFDDGTAFLGPLKLGQIPPLY